MSNGKQQRIQREAALHRQLAAASAQVKAERDAEWQRALAAADARRAAFAAKPAVDPASVVPGVWALDRRGRAGEVKSVGPKNAAVLVFGSTMRFPLDSIIAVKAPAGARP